MAKRLLAARGERDVAALALALPHLGHGIGMVGVDPTDRLLQVRGQLLPRRSSLRLLGGHRSAGGGEPALDLGSGARGARPAFFQRTLERPELDVLPLGILQQRQLRVLGSPQRVLEVIDLRAKSDQPLWAGDVSAHQLTLAGADPRAARLGVAIDLAQPALQRLAMGPSRRHGRRETIGLDVATELLLQVDDLGSQSLNLLHELLMVERDVKGVHRPTTALYVP